MRRADFTASYRNFSQTLENMLLELSPTQTYGTAHNVLARVLERIDARLDSWGERFADLDGPQTTLRSWSNTSFFDGAAQSQTPNVTFGIISSKPDEHPEGFCRCAACASTGNEFDSISPPDTGEPVILDPLPVVPVAAPRPTVIETTDAAANTGTAYTLLVGQTAQGTLNVNGDRDFFAVDLVAGQTYSFALVGTGSNNVIDPYLRLMDSSGFAQLAFDDDSLPNNNSVFTYTPVSTGTHYISAGSFDDIGTGQYGVTVTAGTRPSFDIPMGAGALDRDVSWSTPGTGAVVTYAFRASPATYTVSGSNIATFTQLTATQMDAVRAALQAWSDVSGIQFVEVNPGGFSDSATMLFANYTDGSDGAGAFAFFPGSTANTASAGDVWLNTNSIPTGSVINPGSYAYSAIMHEIGHAIGLSHPGSYNAGPGQTITYATHAQFTEDSDQYSLMTYFDESNTGSQFLGHPETPMMFDIYAAQQIYGINTATRSGDTTYGYNSNAGGVYNFATNPVAAFTIWDGGGIDTLDVSGSTLDAIVDLNEGRFSSVNNGVNNIAIALGVTIENAITGTGNDTIHGNAADNRLQGGTGFNTLNGNDGNDTLVGGLGIDTMNGGGGDDIVAYETSSAGVNIDLQANTVAGGDAAGDTLAGIESIAGSNQADQLFGNAAANRLIGNGGADFIQGRGGADSIQGGDGDDWLDGGAGGDTIDGGNGLLDVAAYGASPSGVNLDLQANTFSGGDAAGDVLTNVEGVSGSGFADQLFGNANANRLFGQGGADFIQGRAGADTIDGGDGDDWLDGGAGGDQIFGGAGNDIVAYGASASAINADLAAFTFSGGDAAGDTYSGVEGVSGSGFNDQIFGDANANRLFGQGGNDFIQGRAGADTIDGGDGDDWLDGGAGGDQIFGGAGANDVVAYGASLAAINADLQAFTFSGGDATGDTYSGVEGVSGSSFGDQIFGNGVANRLFGQGGADFIQGRGGIDVIDGGDGDDWLDGGTGGDQIAGGNGTNDTAAYGSSTSAVTLNLETSTYAGGDAAGDTLSGIESLSGSAHGDSLTGNASANRLFGQAGADTLAGRGGNDQLTGGNDNDIFVFADNGGIDTIYDFDDFGDDTIQLSISGVTDFAGVQLVMTQVGADVVIDFANTDIVLANTTLASVGLDDFGFV